MRVLVTGGAGYVGGFTARRLLAAGHEVTVLDNLCAGHREALPAEVLRVGDIGDRDAVAEVLSGRRIEAVIHFAAHVAVAESVEHPRRYYRNNVANTLNLLEAMLDHDVDRIVFSSTCAVYGEAEKMPLTEETLLAPAQPYAFSKLCIERMIQDFSCAYGLRFVILRYFNAAGASLDGSHGEDHDPETHLIPNVIRATLGEGPALRVFGKDYPTSDGTCLRDYVHVEDLASAHELALGSVEGGIFNVGTGHGSTVLEVIRAVERVAGRGVPHEIVERRPGDVPQLVASCERIQRGLGWTAELDSLDKVVESAWTWHSSHPRGYAN